MFGPSSRLRRRLRQLVEREGRRVLSISADPENAARLLSGPGAAPPRLYGRGETLHAFDGYPLHLSPRRGVWVTLAPRGELPTQIEVR